MVNFSVRRLDEAEVVDFGIYTETGYKADVRAFRGLDRAESAVVGIVHVAHLESCTLTRETAGAEGRHTALVRDLGQRVGLVHELRKGVGAEESVDYRRDGLCVDQVDRSKHFVVAHIHAFADCTRHTREAYCELVVELLTNGAHAAVAQMVDVVYLAL